MGTKIGNIWAQWVRWNSTSSTNTRRVVFSQPRNIMAYSSMSGYFFSRSHHSHGAFGGSEPPWFRDVSTGIAYYIANGVKHPSDGEYNPPRPYIQADNATEIKFRLSAAAVGGGGGASVWAHHVINYFE